MKSMYYFTKCCFDIDFEDRRYRKIEIAWDKCTEVLYVCKIGGYYPFNRAIVLKCYKRNGINGKYGWRANEK